MIRVFVADDHPLVRAGLRNLLREEHDVRISGEAASAPETLIGLETHPSDVLVMDFSMPGRSGLDLIREVRVRMPDLRILVLSMHPEERFAVRSLRAGASGYITKDRPPEEIMNAIRRVFEGRRYVTPSLAEILAQDLGKGEGKLPHERLSDREFQVMCMIAQGRKVSEIAGELSLSVRTINTFRSRIMAKMHARSNAELTHYALEHRLID